MEIGLTDHICYYGYKFSENEIKKKELKTTKPIKNQSYGKRICYSLLFNDLRGFANKRQKTLLLFNIEIFKGLGLLSRQKKHLYILNKREREIWLRELNRIVPFHYAIDEEDEKSFIVKISTYANSVQAKFLTTAIRYMCETEYAFMLKDAIKLQSNGLYKDLHLINLICLLNGFNFGQHCGHGFMTPNRLPYMIYSYEILKEEFSSMDGYNGLMHEIINGKSTYDEERPDVRGYFRDEFELIEEYNQVRSLFSSKNVLKRNEMFYERYINKWIKDLKWNQENN